MTTATKCSVCGKPITRSGQKTCSRACEGKRRNKHVTLRCRVCGKPFEVSWPRRRKAKFCSVPCRNQADRKVKRRPNKEQLEFLIQQLTLKQIADQYDVTETTIVCWLSDAGLKRPTRAERNRIKQEARMRKKREPGRR